MWNTLWHDAGTGLDTRGTQSPVGTWVVLADETARSTPMTVSITPATGYTNFVASGTNPIAGPVVGNTQFKNRWEFHRDHASQRWKRNAQPVLFLTTHSGSGNVTLTNIRIFAGDPWEISPGVKMSESMKAAFQPPGAFLRSLHSAA